MWNDVQKQSGNLEDDSIEHGTESLNDVGRKELLDVLFQVLFGIQFAYLLNDELVSRYALFVLNGFVVSLGEVQELLDGGLVVLCVSIVVWDRESNGPFLLVQIGQHFLLQFILTIVDGK